jgi:hypothetical protein
MVKVAAVGQVDTLWFCWFDPGICDFSRLLFRFRFLFVVCAPPVGPPTLHRSPSTTCDNSLAPSPRLQWTAMGANGLRWAVLGCTVNPQARLCKPVRTRVKQGIGIDHRVPKSSSGLGAATAKTSAPRCKDNDIAAK